MKNLSIESLYQIAQKMEQDAVVFYQKLIDESPEDSHKRLFRLIQSEEKKHLYTFNEIINKVWGNKLKRDLPVESEITSFYLKSIQRSSRWQMNCLIFIFPTPNYGLPACTLFCNQSNSVLRMNYWPLSFINILKTCFILDCDYRWIALFSKKTVITTN